MKEYQGGPKSMIGIFKVLLKGESILFGVTVLGAVIGAYLASLMGNLYRSAAVVDSTSLAVFMKIKNPYNKVHGLLKDIRFGLKKVFRCDYIRNSKLDFHEPKNNLRSIGEILCARLSKVNTSIKQLLKTIYQSSRQGHLVK